MKWLDSHFFIKPIVIKSLNDIDIEKRKNFVGLSSKSKGFILPTIYDDIIPVNSNIVCVYICDKLGFYGVNLCKWIIEPVCDNLAINDFYNSIEIIQDNKHGLIDIDNQRLLIAPYYDNVSINSKCNYVWVEQNGLYHYIKRSTGEMLTMPGAVDAYDTDVGEDVMFIKKNNGTVECVDEKGNIAIIAFRHIMKKNHGRLKLYNSKKHSFVVIDTYGRILN